MSFSCYTATDGRVETGIDGAYFPNQAQPRVMPSAAIEIDLHPDVDSPRVAQLYKSDDPSLYSFGEARLAEPAKTDKPVKSSCLIAVDLRVFWPTGDLGDESQLVVLTGSGWAVLKAKAGATFLTSDGPTLVWDPGAKPKLVSPETLAPATRAFARKAREAIKGMRTLRVSS